MTIITQNQTYIFKPTADFKHLQVTGGARNLIVSEIKNIRVGKSMIITGYMIDESTNTPMTKQGVVYIATTPIVDILP